MICSGSTLAGQAQLGLAPAAQAFFPELDAPSAALRTPTVAAHPLRLRSLPRNILVDQKAFWTSPARLRVRDLRWVLPLSGLTAGLIAADTRIEAHLPDGAGFIDGTRIFSTAGVAALGGTAGVLYVWGRFGAEEHKREAGLLSAEAVANSVIVFEVSKFATGRERPLEGDRQGRFWHGGRSFPSGHAAIAWSTATVLAHEYPTRVSKIVAYGLASAITVSRVTGRRHFASDTFVGSVVGWHMGRQIFRRRHTEQSERSNYGSFYRSAHDLARQRERATHIGVDDGSLAANP